MLQIELSASATLLRHRHLRSLALLFLISLLTSLTGTPAHSTITNSWEGLIWGMADPVINLDGLVRIVAIGLFSVCISRGTFIAGSFLFTAIFGTFIHLLPASLPDPEIAIAISTIGFGAMLVTSHQFHWVVWALLGAIAGLFHGYTYGASLAGSEIFPLFAYVIGMTLTQYVIAMSAREIYPLLASKIPLAGLAFCAVGIVFLHNSMI
ncbi:HupE/UreJ family protein [Fortiea contorta]|uniref:HupE/UreJ family protein n=1 Tax=Fortiea contorta TaxID=1892405 RepID=UPI00034C2F8E|nr:HupE/UreJ family protein [Fortiea contorta]